jgi:hypothetical protein
VPDLTCCAIASSKPHEAGTAKFVGEADPITGNAEGPNISKRLTPEQKQELDRHLLSYSIQPKLKIAQPRRAKYSSLWFHPLNQRLTLVQGFAPVTGDCPSWDTHCPFVGMKIDG